MPPEAGRAAVELERLRHQALRPVVAPKPNQAQRRLAGEERAGHPADASAFGAGHDALDRQLSRLLDAARLVDRVAEVHVRAAEVAGSAQGDGDLQRLAQVLDAALPFPGLRHVHSQRVERIPLGLTRPDLPGDRERLLGERHRLRHVIFSTIISARAWSASTPARSAVGVLGISATARAWASRPSLLHPARPQAAPEPRLRERRCDLLARGIELLDRASEERGRLLVVGGQVGSLTGVAEAALRD